MSRSNENNELHPLQQTLQELFSVSNEYINRPNIFYIQQAAQLLINNRGLLMECVNELVRLDESSPFEGGGDGGLTNRQRADLYKKMLDEYVEFLRLDKSVNDDMALARKQKHLNNYLKHLGVLVNDKKIPFFVASTLQLLSILGFLASASIVLIVASTMPPVGAALIVLKAAAIIEVASATVGLVTGLGRDSIVGKEGTALEKLADVAHKSIGRHKSRMARLFGTVTVPKSKSEQQPDNSGSDNLPKK